MMNNISTSSILIVGQIVVDVNIAKDTEEPKLRLGGITHAARTLWALGCKFSVAYIAPDYLDKGVQSYMESINADSICKIGTVTGAPNVLLIREPRECGDQGYEFLLRDEFQVQLNNNVINEFIKTRSWESVLIFGGQFDLHSILNAFCNINTTIHIDTNSEDLMWNPKLSIGRPVDTLILSTSSDIFIDMFKGNIESIKTWGKKTGSQRLLLKENRGGSRLFTFNESSSVIETPAQIRTIVHSVGVGDCFDATYLALRKNCEETEALRYASCVASEYASTTYPEDFRKAAQGWLSVPKAEIATLSGVFLPWEERPNKQIYIAAPDFDYIDTRHVRQVENALRYHNFSPRLPIQENGQVGPNASSIHKAKIYKADMNLLCSCSLLIAILTYDDPGTLIEIGWALATDRPIIVYDPYNRAENLMLTESAQIISSNLDEIIIAVFETVAKMM